MQGQKSRRWTPLIGQVNLFQSKVKPGLNSLIFLPVHVVPIHLGRITLCYLSITTGYPSPFYWYGSLLAGLPGPGSTVKNISNTVLLHLSTVSLPLGTLLLRLRLSPTCPSPNTHSFRECADAAQSKSSPSIMSIPSQLFFLVKLLTSVISSTGIHTLALKGLCTLALVSYVCKYLMNYTYHYITICQSVQKSDSSLPQHSIK